MGEPISTANRTAPAPASAPAKPAAPTKPQPVKVTSGNLAPCKLDTNVGNAIVQDVDELSRARGDYRAVEPRRPEPAIDDEMDQRSRKPTYYVDLARERFKSAVDTLNEDVMKAFRSCLPGSNHSKEQIEKAAEQIEKAAAGKFVSGTEDDFMLAVSIAKNTLLKENELPEQRATGITKIETKPSGIGDASGSGVTQAAPVSTNVQDRKAQVAEKYWKELHDIRAKSMELGRSYLAAKNAAISTFGVDPADPKFDLKEFHPDQASLAAVNKTIYLTYRLPGSDRRQYDQDIDSLANPLDGLRLELMANDLNSFVKAYRAAPNAEARKSLRETPEGQRALRNAAIWAATADVWDNDPQRWLKAQEIRRGAVVEAYLRSDKDLTADFLRHFESVRRK